MNWRVIVAVVVAFVVGIGAGGLVEHERLKHKSNSSASGSKKGTPTTVSTAAWFGSRASTACPALKSWSASAVASYQALYTKTPWKTKQATLLKQIDAAGSAYKAMVPIATPAGKAQLQFLVGHQTQLSAAVQKATSEAAYLKAQQALNTARVKHDIAIVSQAANRCSAG